MTILALEFSTFHRSVAVLSQPDQGAGPMKSPPGSGTELRAVETAGEVPGKLVSAGMTLRVAEREAEVVETGLAASRPLPMVERALEAAGLQREQVDTIAVGLGPGSYTGIRAAIALAQGWQLAAGVRLLGISSAECLAWQASEIGISGRVNVVIDAQRGDVYVACYETGPGVCRESNSLRLVSGAEAAELSHRDQVFVGPQVTRWFPSGRVVFPSAAQLARMALDRNDTLMGEQMEPIYLRETQFAKTRRGKPQPPTSIR